MPYGKNPAVFSRKLNLTWLTVLPKNNALFLACMFEKYLSTYLPTYIMYLSIYPSTYLFILSIHPFIYLFIYSIPLSLCLSVCLSIHPSIHTSKGCVMLTCEVYLSSRCKERALWTKGRGWKQNFMGLGTRAPLPKHCIPGVHAETGQEVWRRGLSSCCR